MNLHNYGELFNKNYFENGRETGVSLYENYRWMPEFSIPIAKTLIKKLKIKKNQSILDFGCAKGFIVKALRQLGYEAYGLDISEYAINNADPEIKQYVGLPNIKNREYDIGFCKDVLEHCQDIEQLRLTVTKMIMLSSKWLVIVPLGNTFETQYVIPEYDLDTTHYIKLTKKSWLTIFKTAGFNVVYSSYLMKGIKDNWNKYKKGNLFCILEKK